MTNNIKALRSGNISDGTLGSDTEGSDDLEDDQSTQENIVDVSERALAQVSAVLDAATSVSAAAAQPTVSPTTGYSAHAFAAGGEQNIDGQPIKKKVIALHKFTALLPCKRLTCPPAAIARCG